MTQNSAEIAKENQPRNNIQIIKKGCRQMKNCFVVCPIGEEGTETRKRSDQILKHIIAPVCESEGYEVVRVDKINDSDSINQTIIKHLNESDLVIADLTDHNSNAFFETGYRTALGKPLIQLTQEGEKLPFDVSGTRTIFYNLSDLDKTETTKQKLRETIKVITIDKEDSSNESLQVDMQNSQNKQIISLLFDVKDSIEALSTSISKKKQLDVEDMVSIITSITSQLQKSNRPMEEVMQEKLISELISNPDSILKLMNKIDNSQR